MKKFLTIAGSDSSGGAGIQADLKTAAAHGVYGMSVITALTAQNTTGVFGVSSVSGEFVKAQGKAVFEDIFPDAVKIGMVFSEEIISATAEILSEYKPPHIVCDTVMVATSGSPLLEKSAEKALTERLFEQAGFAPKVLFSTASNLSKFRIVELGLGCALLPAVYAVAAENVVYFRLKERPSWQITLCSRRGGFLSRAEKRYLALCTRYWQEREG